MEDLHRQNVKIVLRKLKQIEKYTIFMDST